jgi:multicomponent Na+:H+ antiporter subunit D
MLFLFMFGIGKAALMPMHRWLPAAMVAPTPVSALLHAVAVVKAGVFSVVKVVVYIFGLETLQGQPWAEWLLYAAGFTIIAASLVALRQDNLKKRARLLHGQSALLRHPGRRHPGAGLGDGRGPAYRGPRLRQDHPVLRRRIHLYRRPQDRGLQLKGIGRRMPWTMGAFTIGALSMIGVPPAAGFLSKWYMLLGSFETEQMLAVAVIVLSTLLNAAYFVPIVVTAFSRPDPDDRATHGEAPLAIVVALTATAGLTLLLFFFHQVPLDLAREMVEY